tara:strand:+ start:398 stop:1024 length:627 start_codon:yes stop_codon:yes gene_type:complete
MITSEDKKIILDFTKEVTPSVLKDINFNPNVKEVGHSFGDRFEDEFVKKLLTFSSDFTEAVSDRDMDDIKFKGNLINIKFGYKKNGQPNICSMKRLFNSLHENKVDSYYILSIDAHGPDFLFFDVYDYLDYTNFNYGTGQLMLCENKMKKVYTFNESFTLTKEQKICKMGKMMKEECERHITLKKRQQDKIDRIVDGYKNILSEFCIS